jgi:exopolysaccharide biosynthesis WecB/TagA/CpsF family protein
MAAFRFCDRPPLMRRNIAIACTRSPTPGPFDENSKPHHAIVSDTMTPVRDEPRASPVGAPRRLNKVTTMTQTDQANVTPRAFAVGDVAINVMSMAQAVDSIILAARCGDTFSVHTLNLDHFVKLRSNPAFRDAYDQARFITADGFPIVMMGRLAGVPIARTTGADLVMPLCREAARHQLPVFLLGATRLALAASVRRLTRRYRDLAFAGCLAPGPNFDPCSKDADVAIARIRNSGARICFLALGAPKQEIFAARCLAELPGTALVCIGAALDFIGGTQSRAPHFAQQAGLEWLWRIATDPWRLAPRYMRCLAAVPRLVAMSLPQILAHFPAKARPRRDRRWTPVRRQEHAPNI